jgi:ppGpp synthetase/RelA/SpoT-type nucleotidyltranferase
MRLSPIGKRWHQRQIEDFGKMRKSYQRYEDFLEKVLKLACKKYAPQAIVDSRTKTLPSFAEKAIRKLPKSDAVHDLTTLTKWKKFFDPVNEFTDLCGARVITKTQYEVERVCEFILKNFTIDEVNSEDKRSELKHDQFGYISVHYIVQMQDRKEILGIPVPSGIGQLKAEVQVRTLLQHAWADVSHDSLYKHQFKVPEKWHRDMARLAARLEAADREFTQFVESLDTFAADCMAYLSNDQIADEISILDTILENEKDENQRMDLTLRKARIYKSTGNWKYALDELAPYAQSQSPAMIKELGNALCRLHRGSPSGRKYIQGQRLLEQALGMGANDAEALGLLAWSWEPIDSRKAEKYYAEAYGLRPTDPYYLASFLDFEIANGKHFSSMSLLEPAMRNAIRTCRAHADVNIELPRSLFVIGRFHLLLGEPDQGLSAYIEAVDLCLSLESSISEACITEELKSLSRLEHIQPSLEGSNWVKLLLISANTLKSKRKKALKEIQDLSSKKIHYKGPVVIVAGSCSAMEEHRLDPYRPLLTEALAGFEGEIISGGTISGVSGIVGGLTEPAEDGRQRYKTIGYLPQMIPAKEVMVDERYDTHIVTAGTGFTPLQPLQMWADLLASGVQPSQVKMVGIGGGKIAAMEYRLALALGAEVGILADSRRAADELLNDHRWRHHRNLVSLPADRMTVKALLLSPSSLLDPDSLEMAARSSHENAVKKERHKLKDPTMESWKKLDKKFRESSIQQKLYAEAILRYAGYGLRKKKKDKITPITFPPDKLELMAEMEHGRWNVERIRSGWTLGERDPDKKISPYLRPWTELKGLPKDPQKWDFQYVSNWPKDFKEAGLEIYDLNDSDGENK